MQTLFDMAIIKQSHFGGVPLCYSDFGMRGGHDKKRRSGRRRDERIDLDVLRG